MAEKTKNTPTDELRLIKKNLVSRCTSDWKEESGFLRSQIDFLCSIVRDLLEEETLK